jgi:hypothetical protein
MPGHAELAHHEHVEWNAQRLRDLVGDRDAPARQPEDDDVVAARVVAKRGGEDTAGIAAIGKAELVADLLRLGA